MARPPSEFHPGMPDCSIATPPRYCVCPIAQLLRSIATRACERSIGAIAVTINCHPRFLIWSYHIAVRLASFCPFVFFDRPLMLSRLSTHHPLATSTSPCNPNLLNFLILSASIYVNLHLINAMLSTSLYFNQLFGSACSLLSH